VPPCEVDGHLINRQAGSKQRPILGFGCPLKSAAGASGNFVDRFGAAENFLLNISW
jgi:hypothetical protein